MERNSWVFLVPLPEFSNGFSGSALGLDQLIDRDNAAIAPGTVNHTQNSFDQRPGYVVDGHGLPGFECVVQQPGRVLCIAEGGIQHDLGSALRPGCSQSRALSRSVTSCREYNPVAVRFGAPPERTVEQLVPYPLRCRVNRDAVFRGVPVVSVEKSGRVIRVQNVAESLRVFGEEVLGSDSTWPMVLSRVACSSESGSGLPRSIVIFGGLTSLVP